MSDDHQGIIASIDRLWAVVEGRFDSVEARDNRQDDRMTRIEESLTKHVSNHHGPASKVRQGAQVGAVGGALGTAIVLLVEILKKVAGG